MNFCCGALSSLLSSMPIRSINYASTCHTKAGPRPLSLVRLSHQSYRVGQVCLENTREQQSRSAIINVSHK
jgi:hypothetical protein